MTDGESFGSFMSILDKPWFQEKESSFAKLLLCLVIIKPSFLVLLDKNLMNDQLLSSSHLPTSFIL